LNFAFLPWVAKAELSADDAMVLTIIAVANTTAINAKEVCFFVTVIILFKIVSNLYNITIS
jgi:hypothetical protein